MSTVEGCAYLAERRRERASDLAANDHRRRHSAHGNNRKLKAAGPGSTGLGTFVHAAAMVASVDFASLRRLLLRRRPVASDEINRDVILRRHSETLTDAPHHASDDHVHAAADFDIGAAARRAGSLEPCATP